jgi:hypothetical protein
MTAVEKPKTIEEVVLRLQQERPILAKTKSGQVGNQKTRYADLVQVNEVVLKLLNDMETIWTCRPNLEAGVFGLFYSLRHVPSGTEITGVWPLGGTDNPQKMGSAVTYGRRYALLAVTGIVAEDEDDDGAAASGQRTVQRERRPVAKPAPRVVGEAQNHQTVQRSPRAPQPPLPGEAGLINPGQMRAINTLLTKLGIEEDAARHEQVSTVLGEPVESLTKLTEAEASTIIPKLQTLVEARGKGQP